MRKIKNVSFLDLLSTFNLDFELVRKPGMDLELWYHGDDWGMTDTEKEALYAQVDTDVYLSYQVGTIVQDASGNITALNLGHNCQDRSVLMQLCTFIADGRNFDGNASFYNLEMEPEGHLIRITVVEFSEWPDGNDEMVMGRVAMGTLTYDSRLKALIAA